MIIPQADRLKDISEYYFSKKLEQIRVMNEAGRDVVNLGIGSPDLPPSDETIKAAGAALTNPANHGYASYRGTVGLRQAMSEWYKSTYEVAAQAQTEILPLLGSKEGLFYISMAFLNPGDEVLVPNPGYPAYAAAAKLAGAQVRSYNLTDSNHWYPDFAELEKTDLSRVKLMWVNYPHMPTGQAASEELFAHLIKFGEKNKILICHDNPYGMVLNTAPPLSLLKFDPEKKHSLELNSFSKAFNMAGWRVGMMIASKEITDTVIKVKSNVDSGMFLPVQAGAQTALKNSKEWHRERNEIYVERRHFAHRLFDHLGFTYAKDQVGLFVWAKAPASIASVEKFIDEILEKNAIFLTPGLIFGSNGQNFARCSLCVPSSRFEVALSRLGGGK